MAETPWVETLPRPVADVVATAIGAAARDDPVSPRSGGPAGNARLTGWAGLLLLALFLAETATLISVSQLITWHIVIGVVLVPLTLVKTATTGWRILRYYGGDERYRRAGPPPLLLRVLGPLVILTALAVLGSGLALIALGARSFDPLVTVAGFQVDAVTVHKACFAAWLVVMGLHVLARTLTALDCITGRHTSDAVPGGRSRAGVLAATLAAGGVAAALVVHVSGQWTQHQPFHEKSEATTPGLNVAGVRPPTRG